MSDSMANKQQTAVEWLFSQLPDHLRLSRDGFDAFQIAKGMEREQIENAYWDGGQDIPTNENRCAEYYDKTYAN